MNETTQRGITILKSGDRITARRILREAIQQNPNDTQAWLWLSGAVDTDDEREKCLRKVLEIDPQNLPAARGLEKVLRARKPQDIELIPAEPEKQAPIDPVKAVPIPQTPINQTAAENSTPVYQEINPSYQVALPEVHQNSGYQTSENPGRVIFRARPSVVPTLLSFWIFLAGAIWIGILQPTNDEIVNNVFPAAIGIVLEGIVLFLLIRNFRTRYVLTDQQLSMPLYRKKVNISVVDMYHAEVRQSLFQKLLGTGDILIDGVVNQQLNRLRLRNISECKRHLNQINTFIREDS